MLRRLLSAAATGALLLGLAACGEPIDGPATAAPPSIDIAGPSDGGGDAEPSDGGGGPTDEPTAEAPDIPAPDPADFAGMDEHTPEGAEQAFMYYIAMVYWGYQTGSSEGALMLQGSTCSECIKLTDKIVEINREGTYWGPVELSEYGSTTSASENYDIEVGYVYTVGTHDEPKVGSDEPTKVPEKTYTARGGLYWTEGNWSVGGVDIGETDHEL